MSSEEVSAYARDGYVIRKNLFSRKEVALFLDRVRAPIEAEIAGGLVFAKKDHEGRTGLVKGLTKADEVRFGFLGRDERLVDLAQDVIGKPVYRYAHEMPLKQPAGGGGDGGWGWHQDFGFFHTDGLLAPELTAIWLVFHKATRENGCMRVLKGSHKLGRLNHNTDLAPNRAEYVKVNQTQVEQKALEAAMKRFETVYVELEPGDAMI
ncbi:phytanoyl-CoA dioxygenase family protein, partial [Bradyrhizobium retamae]